MYAKAEIDEDATFSGGEFDLAPSGKSSITVTDVGGETIIESKGLFGQNGKVMATRTIRLTLNGGAIIQWENL